MIKAIFFDFGQTLVDSANGFRTAEKEAQTRIFSDISLTSWENFLSNYRRIRKEFHGQSMFSRQSLWEEVYFYYCLVPDLTRLETWEYEYWETVKARTALFPESERVLENLDSRYMLALITNTQGQKTGKTHRMSQFSNLKRFFKVIIVAGEAGVHPKPDPEPFRLCLERLNIVPNEAVYVGDDWRIDICGAKDVGIQPIWLQHYSVNRNWPVVETSVPIIKSLDQLLDLDDVLS
jgi:HAD superfamily hydrolase (TIGR01549 family)